jgi:hypothetical protein
LPNFVKALWKRWTVIAHVIGSFQARVVLTVLYHVVLPPFAFIARATADRLRLRRTSTPVWHTRRRLVPTLEDGRRQSS